MPNIANKIHYLRACYQADLRAVSLLNYYSKKASHQLLLNSFEPISGEVTEFPVSTEWAKGIETHMSIYAKEKELYCGAVFLVGSTNIAGKNESVIAPLYLYPTVLLEEDGIYYVSIVENDPVINPAIYSVIGNGQTGLQEALNDELPKGYLNFDRVDQLERILEKFFPENDHSMLSQLPKILSEKNAKELIKNAIKNNDPIFLPMAGLCLMKKPVGSRGILNELEELAQSSFFSRPLKILFGKVENQKINKPFNLLHVPAILSATQNKIVSEALKYPLRLVIGPPGTGKSFTIAALATEMLARSKSVLIVSKNVEAVDVVAEKVERDLGLKDIVVRASRKGYRKAVQVRLKNLSMGMEFKDSQWIDVKVADYDLSKMNKKIRNLEKRIVDTQSKFLSDGELLIDHSDSLLDKLKLKWRKYQKENKEPIWRLIKELRKETEKRNKFLKKYIHLYFYHYVKQAFWYSRKDMQNMNKALRARTGIRKETIFDETNFKKVLKALPVWTCSIADVHKVLPHDEELFDLAIIDEATQCDMASCLPILQRAKSVLVVGDPKQLRHLSFLSYKQQSLLGKQYKLNHAQVEDLNYRDKSLLDLIDERIPSQDSVYFLNEHYRSMPDIISFSHEHFYDRHLHIMTENLNTKNKQHNFIKNINGKRNARGYNQVEADEIINSVKEMIDDEKDLEMETCQSIGIISPFREQVRHLQRKVAKQFNPSEIERHRIMIGTPFSFQGEERDVVFISFVLDDKSHPSAFIYLNRADVFNVCVTRARVLQFNFISFSLQKINNDYLIAKYLSHTDLKKKSLTNNSALKGDEFLAEVKEAIEEIAPEEIFVGYEIAGVKIDLLVVKNKTSYGIDLVGYPGEYEESLTLENWKMIYRTGIQVFYLPFWDWVTDKQETINAMKDFIMHD